MKKIILACFALLSLFGCSVDNDPVPTIEFTPVSEVMLPFGINTTPERGETIAIEVSYTNLSSCHSFDAFLVNETGAFTFDIILATKIEDQNCSSTQTQSLSSATYEFTTKADTGGQYILNFWQGKDSEGVERFIPITITVP